jgi:hypothetical protein
MNAPVVQRRPNGQLLPGAANLNPNGRPRGLASIEQIREKHGHRVEELIENLFELTRTGSEATKLAANRELLDRIIGKPQISADVSVTRLGVGQLYLQALQRASQRAHAISGEKVIDGDDDNSNAGAPRDPTEIIQ